MKKFYAQWGYSKMTNNIKQVTMYETEDGQVFKSEEEARVHEVKVIFLRNCAALPTEKCLVVDEGWVDDAALFSFIHLNRAWIKPIVEI